MDPIPLNSLSREQLESDLFSCAISLHESWRSFLIDNGSTDGLTMTHVTALLAIREHQPIPSRQLGRILRITPGAVTQLIDLMVEEDLVERQDNPSDRRVSELVLTKAGAERLELIMERRRKTFVEIYQVLSDQELQELYTSYKKLAANLAEI